MCYFPNHPATSRPRLLFSEDKAFGLKSLHDPALDTYLSDLTFDTFPLTCQVPVTILITPCYELNCALPGDILKS